MQFETSAGALFNGGTGALLVAMGLWVVTRRPARAAHVTFAGFSIALGAGLIANNLVPHEGSLENLPASHMWIRTLQSVLLAIGSMAAVLLAFLLPGRAKGPHRRAAWWVTIVAIGLFSTVVVTWFLRLPTLRPDYPQMVLVESLFHSSTGVTLSAAFAIWGARARLFSEKGDVASAREAAILGLGLAPYLSMWLWASVAAYLQVDLSTSWRVARVAAPLAAATFGVSMWLFAGALRPVRRFALVILLLLVGTGAIHIALGGSQTAPIWGISRLFGGGVIAYAILRHQLLGIDLGLRWTISKGTVATVLLAVFFIVSLGASEFIIDQLGYVLGALAVGLMFIALRPLQRLGERVASRALPNVENTAEYRTVRKQELYRAAYSSALHDGQVTERERDVLATLQEQLGLLPTEARKIEKSC